MKPVAFERNTYKPTYSELHRKECFQRSQQTLAVVELHSQLYFLSFVVPGDWTELSTPVNKHAPLSLSRSNPLSPIPAEMKEPVNGQSVDHKEHKKIRDTITRKVHSSTRHAKTEEHTKISKKASVQPNSSLNGKDQEDGGSHSSLAPTAGSIHALMFASTYTRKHGKNANLHKHVNSSMMRVYSAIRMTYSAIRMAYSTI